MTRDEIIAEAAALLGLPVEDVRLDSNQDDPWMDVQSPRYTISARIKHSWSKGPEWGPVMSSKYSHAAALAELRATCARKAVGT